MANKNFSQFTQDVAPTTSQFVVGYDTAVSGGERRFALSDILGLFRTQVFSTANGILQADGFGNVTSTGLTYSGSTLSVPAGFGITGDGSLAFAAGGANKDITLTPSGTGVLYLQGTSISAPGGNNTALKIGSDSSAGMFLVINAATENSKRVSFQSAGSTRWYMYSIGGGEPGANAGSDLKFEAYSDAGVLIDAPLTITRASGGSISIVRPVSVSGVLSVTNTTEAGSGTGSIVSSGGIYAAKAIRSASTTASSSTTTGSGIFGGGIGVAGQVTANAWSSILSGFTASINTNGAGGNSFILSAAVSNRDLLTGQTSGSNRWILRVDGTAESGSNVGSDFSIRARNDAGGDIGAAISCTRSNLNVAIGGDLTVSGGDLTLTGTSTITGGAGNMTITAGTGNSRTMTLQTTTSGGVATTFLSGDATQNTTIAGALIGANTQALSGAGAIDITHLNTDYTSTGGAQALTLANGTVGQVKTIVHVVDGGSGVLTPTTKVGFTTITFTNAGDSVTLRYTSAGWAIIGIYGAVAA